MIIAMIVTVVLLFVIYRAFVILQNGPSKTPGQRPRVSQHELDHSFSIKARLARLYDSLETCEASRRADILARIDDLERNGIWAGRGR